MAHFARVLTYAVASYNRHNSGSWGNIHTKYSKVDTYTDYQKYFPYLCSGGSKERVFEHRRHVHEYVGIIDGQASGLLDELARRSVMRVDQQCKTAPAHEVLQAVAGLPHLYSRLQL